MASVEHSQLGQQTVYPSTYDAGLLFPIPRSENRAKLSMTTMHGADVWTAYEVSWLNLRGLPQVAIAEFSIPANSPNLIESKSFKLYLNSLNAHRFVDEHAMMTQVTHDLSGCAGSMVSMRLHEVGHLPIGQLPGECLDDLAVDIHQYEPSADLLQVGHLSGNACWHSHLLKSNCPVTGQPDWGSIVVDMQALKLPAPESLLAYIVSYRNHQDFHEHCVESIYTALMARFQPQSLTVYARYVRRGGLDINPWRSTELLHTAWPTMPRLARQ